MSEQNGGIPPAVLTVVLADTTRTYLALTHENEHVPYERRTVHITLTPEQQAALRPLYTGRIGGRSQYEEIVGVWFEPAEGRSDE